MGCLNENHHRAKLDRNLRPDGPEYRVTKNGSCCCLETKQKGIHSNGWWIQFCRLSAESTQMCIKLQKRSAQLTWYFFECALNLSVNLRSNLPPFTRWSCVYSIHLNSHATIELLFVVFEIKIEKSFSQQNFWWSDTIFYVFNCCRYLIINLTLIVSALSLWGSHLFV